MFPNTVEEARNTIKRAIRYRSGPGAFNEVYLGSMACAAITRKLGGRYGTDNMLDLIDKASMDTLRHVWDDKGFQWILGHYKNAGSKLYKYKVIAEEV